MDKREYRIAARLRIPVISNGIEYKRIAAIVEVYPDDMYIERGIPPHVMLELQDKNGSARVQVQPYTVEAKDKGMFKAQMEAYYAGKE